MGYLSRDALPRAPPWQPRTLKINQKHVLKPRRYRQSLMFLACRSGVHTNLVRLVAKAMDRPTRGLTSTAADNALTFRDFTQTFDLSGALKKVADSNSAQEVFAPLRIVLGSLEALTKVHPFLAIVVIPFKAIVSLELRRRENDRRILALIMQMADMMSQLSVLPAQQAVNTIQQIQLQDILVDVKVHGLYRSSLVQYIQRLVIP